MNKKKEVVFDPQMVANYREMASDLVISDEIIRRLLDQSTTIDNQTKILLIYQPYFVKYVFVFISFISIQYVVT